MPTTTKLEIHPATPARWPDIVTLFGPRGACAGCWCMWPRLEAAAFRRGSGDGNRRALQRLVRSRSEPGLIAYAAGEPVAWVALAPRSDYPRLERSRVLAAVDDRPVWSVVCFFVRRDWRGRGLTTELLRGAARYAAAHGARWLEGYPTDVPKRTGDAFVWTGLASSFERAGFHEVARRSKSRPIMRRTLRPTGTPRGSARRGAGTARGWSRSSARRSGSG
jgi:GNAT superfamily N-acetyltransferase